MAQDIRGDRTDCTWKKWREFTMIKIGGFNMDHIGRFNMRKVQKN
jgi:hypothetical protein